MMRKGHRSLVNLYHALKFFSFVRKNNDVPFIVKLGVFEAALRSPLLYELESWVGADVKSVIKLYDCAMKEMLGVRKTTPNLMWTERNAMNDDPLAFAIRSVISLNTNVCRTIQRMKHDNISDMSVLLRNVHDAINNANTSRCNTYKEINPYLELQDIYRERHAINDLLRISFTNLRLSGHNLAIETGRWNKRGRGRLPVEECVCVCGLVQLEGHVVLQKNMADWLVLSQLAHCGRSSHDDSTRKAIRLSRGGSCPSFRAVTFLQGTGVTTACFIHHAATVRPVLPQAQRSPRREGQTHPHSGHRILASCSLGLRQREQKASRHGSSYSSSHSQHNSGLRLHCSSVSSKLPPPPPTYWPPSPPPAPTWAAGPAGPLPGPPWPLDGPPRRAVPAAAEGGGGPLAPGRPPPGEGPPPPGPPLPSRLP
ncbi:hypothetical protein E2C01_053405 [Portunus trituberculatus]|uniref:Uncharacterized protein n=1 Tax=Portunus trituberculatus TaxID=210409 RepID=A0A5B7GPC6_PORTR|nr:hypothetical protein [Portunus trituberculatus]